MNQQDAFDSASDVLAWYESRPRAVTKDFLSSIRWNEIKEHPLNPRFVPVLIYMRDVESYTEIYAAEMRRTPTVKEPATRKFLERWEVEESDHGNLLNRFLEEAGFHQGGNWRAEAQAAIPFRYSIDNYLAGVIAQCFGKSFSGVHMVWGAINELTTLQGYRRLGQLADHPVLEHILKAIAREETSHVTFYWNMARLKLKQSRWNRTVARFAVDRFWTPVGEGAKPRPDVDYLISTLFGCEVGLECFQQRVVKRVQALPGFADCQTLSKRVRAVMNDGV